MIFDNHDHRIKYYELLLRRSNLENLPEYLLPEGYRFVFYQPGDRDEWISIEKSAKEFETYEQGMESWKRYYEGKDEDLVRRMVFIENNEGQKVATASAYYDIYGNDKSMDGWLHWVAVRREYQGKGLSKPLIYHTLQIMRNLGYPAAKVHTQTTTWLACKIYLDFGFVPVEESMQDSQRGWQIIRTLTEHPTLQGIEPLRLEEILA